MATFTKKTFSFSDQEKFSALSGDFNPVHLDAMVARREIFGEIVVHGMHLLIKGLDIFVSQIPQLQTVLLSSIKTKFFSPVFVDKEFIFNISFAASRAKIEVRDNKSLLISIMDIGYKSRELPFTDDVVSSMRFQKAIPDVILDIRSARACEGVAELSIDDSLCNELFPELLKKFTKTQVAELLSFTRIVGMKCPGRQSLFSGVDLKLEIGPAQVLSYRVSEIIEKFSMINLQVKGPTFTGTLSTMFRPMIIEQPTIREIAAEVHPASFKDMRCLIIGGSRGIGETTAKIIAAGGGKPTITYHMGKEESEKICNQIKAAGFECNCAEVDIDNFERSLERMSEINSINAVFYFASPKILRSNIFDNELFKKFSHYYVAQFDRLIRFVKSYSRANVIFFYPSTVAIDEKTPGLKEYIMAKSAGEYLCESLNKELTGAYIYSARLPRLLTDQTMNLQNYPAESTIGIMHPIIKSMMEWISANINK